MADRREKENTTLLLPEQNGKKQRRRTSGLLAETVLGLFLLTGILYALRDLMYMDLCTFVSCAVGIFTFLLRQALDRAKTDRRIVRTVFYGLTGLLMLGLSPLWGQGLLYILNRAILLWNLRFGTEIGRFAIGSGVAFGSIILWGLLAVPIATLLQTQIRRRALGGPVVLSFAALFLGMGLGQESQMWDSAIRILVALCGLFVFYAAPGRRGGWRSAVILGVLALQVGWLAMTARGYESLAWLTDTKRQLSESFDAFRYGEDNLPEGNLRKARAMQEGDEVRLTLTLEEPEELYLRGFVGATYSASNWKALGYEHYQDDYEGLIGWLSARNFTAQTQQARYGELTAQSEGGEQTLSTVQVENVSAYRKYVYLPASVADWDAGKSVEKKDWQVTSAGFFGTDSYSFQMIADTPEVGEVQTSAWLASPMDAEEEEYLEAESVYYRFASDVYEEMDPELAAAVEEIFYGDDEPEEDFRDLTARIRRVLRLNYDYVEKPEAVPADEDALTWFLTESRSGNAAFYASAAVLAYRAAGYPARYVEGYHLDAQTAAAMAEAGSETVDLTGEAAHAWAEVYISGLGWYPVEVVPGLYLETYTEQLVEGKPAFQVNPQREEEDLSLEDETAADLDGSEKEEAQEPASIQQTARTIAAILLLLLYAAFFLWLILELQRAVRLAFRRAKERESAAEAVCGQRILWLLAAAGVRGDLTHPLELTDQVEKRFPGISGQRFERAVRILQKARFGGAHLRPWEERTLTQITAALERSLLAGKRGFARAWYRYVRLAG